MTAEISEVKTKSFGMRTILLTSWASIATALLLTVLIGGAIYLNDVQSRCDVDDGEGYTRTDQYDTEGEREDMYMDDQLKTQLFIKRNNEGAITLIADWDYNRKISATYLAEMDQCLLTAGEDMDWQWQHAWNSPKMNLSSAAQEEAITVYEEADPDNRVTDMSLLPRYIRPFCEGKQIYWTKPADQQKTSASRQKRADGLVACHYVTKPPYAGYFLCCHKVIAVMRAQAPAGTR